MFLTRLDYNYTGALSLSTFKEWRGKLVMYGRSSLSVLSIPPTTEPPSSAKVVSYQTLGSLNSTFSMGFNSILHVLPIDHRSDRLSVLNSRLLASSQSDQKTRVFIDNIEIGSSYIYFNQTDDELLTEGETSIDTYYNEHPIYIHKKYIIRFVYEKSDRSIWLMISLICIIIVFISILILCIIKSKKAMQSVEEKTGLSTKGDRKKSLEDPLINTHIPSRIIFNNIGESPAQNNKKADRHMSC